MSDISAAQVKELRERTGAGMMDCKKALVETGGDIEKAVELLREKGLASAAKRAGRSANQGLIEAYIHFNNTVGVLVEVNCETDFVANTDEFKAAREGHRAAHRQPRRAALRQPRGGLAGRDRPREPDLRQAGAGIGQARERGREDRRRQDQRYFKEIVLLDQPFVKDDSKTVQQLLDETSAQRR